MHLTVDAIRASFVNASNRQVRAVAVPPPVADIDWQEREFVGWHDLRTPGRAYLVARQEAGPVGVLLRAPGVSTGRRAPALCELCRSVHDADGVRLFVAPKAGAAGRQCDSVGTYICADLECSLYARGRRRTVRAPAEPPGPERVAKLEQRLGAFLDRVVGQAAG